MLSRCGTVIATDRSQSIVKVDSERCDNCVGLCVRFGVPDEVVSDESFDVGQRVMVMMSPSALTYASLAVFGLPLLLFVSTYLMTSSVLVATGAFGVGLVSGVGICRSNALRSRLVLHFELREPL